MVHFPLESESKHPIPAHLFSDLILRTAPEAKQSTSSLSKGRSTSWAVTSPWDQLFYLRTAGRVSKWTRNPHSNQLFKNWHGRLFTTQSCHKHLAPSHSKNTSSCSKGTASKAAFGSNHRFPSQLSWCSRGSTRWSSWPTSVQMSWGWTALASCP